MATIVVDGKRIKVRHMYQRPSGWYFVPSKVMAAAGFASEPLGKDPVKAAARAQELNEAWDRERTAPKRAKAVSGSLAWLCEEFKRSSWYSDLSASTKYDAELCVRNFCSSPLGQMDASKIGRGHVRRLYDTILAAKSLAVANKHAKYLRRILNYGIEIEVIKTNPASGLGLKQNAPRKVLWNPEWVDQFIAKAMELNKPGWALAIAIAYDTSQRPKEVRTALHTQFDGEGISFPAAKKGKAVWCPLEPRTIALINSIPKRAVTIVYGDKGRPITQTAYFAKVFRQIRDAAGIPNHVVPKDLRKTAATEIATGGGRVESLTGHVPNSSALRSYVFVDKPAARIAQEARKRGREKS